MSSPLNADSWCVFAMLSGAEMKDPTNLRSGAWMGWLAVIGVESERNDVVWTPRDVPE